MKKRQTRTLVAILFIPILFALNYTKIYLNSVLQKRKADSLEKRQTDSTRVADSIAMRREGR